MNARFEARNAKTVDPHELSAGYERVRARSLELASPLSPEDCCAQSMPDASPVKWHLAHTTWFFETFVLEKLEQRFEPFHAAFRVMFNSYYNGVGDRHPRPQRGTLTRPALADVRAYREDVDERMLRLIEMRPGDKELRALVALGLNHEQQHQELILTDVKHLLSLNPLAPAYRGLQATVTGHTAPRRWITFDALVAEIGHDGRSFCFDNELPRHKQYLQSYQLASRLVTNAEYLEFIEEGGYRTARLWLSDGWDWVQANRVTQPIYWRQDAEGWHEFTLHGINRLAPDLPAVHLSYYEADAFARWFGARLPTEAEWEHAAATREPQGNFADENLFRPAAAVGAGLRQMFGDAWEWTRSSYAPYPGYREAEGAIGEYNGKFMVNQYVLRGGSCATPADHIRATYRNFFPTTACWQFSGVRLANDCS
jgi:ergothioneine biosynthesis protein EgtB